MNSEKELWRMFSFITSVFVGVYFLLAIGLNIYYKNHLFTNLIAGETSLQGMSDKEIKNYFEELSAEISKTDYMLKTADRDSAGKEIQTLVAVELKENALEIIKNEDRQPFFLTLPVAWLANNSIGKDISKNLLTFDKENARQDFEKKFTEAGLSRRDFDLVYADGEFTTSPGKDGKKVLFENIEKNILTNPENKNITLETAVDKSLSGKYYTQEALSQASSLLKTLPKEITLTYERPIYGGSQKNLSHYQRRPSSKRSVSVLTQIPRQ